MSEIEKAIELIKIIDVNHDFEDSKINKEFHDTVPLLFQALREKQEREKGCDYCKTMKNLPFEEHDVYIDGNGKLDVDDDEDFQLNFCPMCGRKLEESK